MSNTPGEIKLSSRKIKSILGDAEKCARAIDLVHVDDTQPGITRVKDGKTFHYYIGKKKLRKASELERIKRLVIPPAWENVWICRLANGHLQVTGKDARSRKQYKYHPLWISVRNHTKFYRLHEFGNSLPQIREQLKKDLALPGLPANKVLATVVCLMEQTSIRVGNSMYEKLYGSFGLTTLKDKHVKITGANVRFTFKGKKGIHHDISIKSKRLAKIVKSCRDIPGKELFQYYDEAGNHKSVDSGMVNAYLKSITGKDFTAKDFRTWAGTLRALSAFQTIEKQELIDCTTKNGIKNAIVAVLDEVAAHLGNTRSVCKKYYVHPIILDLYENSKLNEYLARLNEVENNAAHEALMPEEKLLIAILEEEGLVQL